MLDGATQPRLDKVTDVVTGILAKHAVKGPLSTAAELSKLGMTSIDMVELMLAVEAEFDLMIPPAEITTENFRTIASIDGLIGKLDGQRF